MSREKEQKPWGNECEKKMSEKKTSQKHFAIKNPARGKVVWFRRNLNQPFKAVVIAKVTCGGAKIGIHSSSNPEYNAEYANTAIYFRKWSYERPIDD